jgi:hypothetical protein
MPSTPPSQIKRLASLYNGANRFMVIWLVVDSYTDEPTPTVPSLVLK